MNFTSWMWSLTFKLPAAFRGKRGERPRQGGGLEVEFLEDRLVPAASANEVYATALYHGALNRGPDPAGLAFWAGRLDAGSPRQGVVDGIVNSPEADAQRTQDLFHGLLGRTANSGELNYWSNRQAQGASPDDVGIAVLGSPEFFAKVGGANWGFLNNLYRVTLNRPLDESGRQYWGAKLAAGENREAVARAMLTAPEATRLEVESTYGELLGRSAGSAGDSYWAGVMNGADTAALIRGVLASDEFFHATQARGGRPHPSGPKPPAGMGRAAARVQQADLSLGDAPNYDHTTGDPLAPYAPADWLSGPGYFSPPYTAPYQGDPNPGVGGDGGGDSPFTYQFGATFGPWSANYGPNGLGAGMNLGPVGLGSDGTVSVGGALPLAGLAGLQGSVDFSPYSTTLWGGVYAGVPDYASVSANLGYTTPYGYGTAVDQLSNAAYQSPLFGPMFDPNTYYNPAMNFFSW